MDSVFTNLAFDGLLVAISDEISQAAFTELISQYYNNVIVPDSITDKFRILKLHIKNHSLDLEGLATKLSTLGYEELSQKARQVQPTKQDRRGSAAVVWPGNEPLEIQPEETSPGRRKKGWSVLRLTKIDLLAILYTGVSNGHETEFHKDNDEPIEAIPCLPPNENDTKYLGRAIELSKKSKDGKTKVNTHTHTHT